MTGGLARVISEPMRACPHPPDQLLRIFPAEDYITGSRFKIALCRSCNLAVTIPQPGPEEISAYYSDGYYGAQTNRRFPAIIENLQRLLYLIRVKRVENCNGGQRGRVLDLGCGRGFLLNEFQDRGWEVSGTELSDQAASYARRVLNLPVRTGSLEEMNMPENHFDAVVMWHVLEHLADPRRALAEVNRVLKHGGVFLVAVPNFGSWEARSSRDKWFHLDVPRHLSHFTRDSLEDMLAAAGFHEQKQYSFSLEYDLFSFVQSSLNRFGLQHNLLYELLRRRGAKFFVDRPARLWEVIATILLSLPLAILSLPVTALAGLFHRAGTMTILAVKENPVAK